MRSLLNEFFLLLLLFFVVDVVVFVLCAYQNLSNLKISLRELNQMKKLTFSTSF